ncbi:MAG: glycosyltransferase family 39 protein [Caldilineaceae bacterium]
MPSDHPIHPYRDFEWSALAVVVAIGAALRLWAIGAKSMWMDEAFSVWVAHLDLPELLHFVATVDHHPPFYYVLLHFWQTLFSDAPSAVRMLSALPSIVAVPILYLAGRILVGRRAAMVAALILAGSPIHVRYAQEARAYSLMTLFAACMLWCLAIYLVDSQAGTWRRRFAMAGVAASQAALMWTHNTAAFLAPTAVNAAVLVPWCMRRNQPSGLPTTREDHFLRGWLAVQIAAVVLWLPWLPTFMQQAGVVYERFWIQPLAPYFVWLTFHNFNLAYPEGWFPGSPWWDLLFWTLAGAGVYALRRRWAVAYLLATLALAPALTEILISFRRPILYDRTILWSTLPYFLLLGKGILWLAGEQFGMRAAPSPMSTSPSRLRRGLAVASAATLAALMTYSLFAYYTKYEKEDWPAAAAYVAQHVGSGDLLLFHGSWTQIPFDYAARGMLIGADERGMPADLFDSGELEAQMTPQNVPALTGLASDYADVWLVYSHESYTDPGGLVPATLAKTHRLAEQKDFDGLRILHYVRRWSPPGQH